MAYQVQVVPLVARVLQVPQEQLVLKGLQVLVVFRDRLVLREVQDQLER